MNFFLEVSWKFIIRLVTFYALFVLSILGYTNACMANTNKKVYDSIGYLKGSNIPSSMQSRGIVVQADEAAKSFKQKINRYEYSIAEVKTEKERLRECLANVLLNAEKKENAQEQVLLSVVGALSNDSHEDFGDLVNLDLLKALKSNTYNGNKLIEKIFVFCKYMNDEISNLKVSNAEKVKLRVRIDELKLFAGNFGLLVSQPTKKKYSTRIAEFLM